MTRFDPNLSFPRAGGNGTWRSLQERHGHPTEEFVDNPIDTRRAEFHPAGKQIGAEALLAWRADLNNWAYDNGFPNPLNERRRSDWDVALGLRLAEDTCGMAESLHPHVWCWLATNLLPHFVLYRWGWPALKDDRAPTSGSAWERFGTSTKNGLHMAVHRVRTYGPELAARASEQEFQSIQYRPAFGLDQRVARVVLQTLVLAFDDAGSYYGKHGGTRALDCDAVCIELRLVNSLRPLCFMPDEGVADIVTETISRLPALREAHRKSEDAMSQV